MTTPGRKRRLQHPEQGRSTVELAQVHVVHEHPTALTLTPPHAVRTETERFRQTRERLVHALNAPCFICRVRQSDLDDPARRADPRVNPFDATVMECHHVHIERSLANAIDRELLAADYPSVRQYATVEEWADSEDNNAAFCDACHRLAPHAVHRAGWPIVQAARYARRDPETGLPYLFAAATPVQAQAALARDERIVADVERMLDGAGNPHG